VGAIADIPELTPDALEQAWHMQTRAAEVGFDWPDISGPMAKLHEELHEIEEALAKGDRVHAARELGDLLFSAVNLSRFLQVPPGAMLRETNARFAARFEEVERRVRLGGKTLQSCSLQELDAVWDEVKRASCDVVEKAS